MILDEAYANKKHCNIIVTQPRRIAARSIASRISEEREWELGSVVGYQVNSNIVRISTQYENKWGITIFIGLDINFREIDPISV